MIESERLLLRPVTLEDIDDIYEYAQDEETLSSYPFRFSCA